MTLSLKLSGLKGKYHKCTVENVEILLAGLLASRSVNLYKMKDELGRLLGQPHLSRSSHYKRLLRFFDRYSASRLFVDVLLWSLSLVIKEVDRFFLDGTEWKIGQFELHVLVLAAQVQGVAVPVYFRIYQHKGVLSEQERIKFLRKSVVIFDLKDKLLIADREFIGLDWFAFLQQQQIKFVIRLRKGMYRKAIQAQGKSYQALEKQALRKGYAQKRFLLGKEPYRLEIWLSTSPEQALVYLLTNELKKKRLGKQYRKRWRIEYCFKHLKTNGFNLEDLALTEVKKVRLMIALVIAAYSQVIAINHRETQTNVELYPNPISQGQAIQLKVRSNQTAVFAIALYDLQGRLLRKQDYPVAMGVSFIQLNPPVILPSADSTGFCG